MLLVLPNRVAGFVGSSVYYLALHLANVPPQHIDRRRVEVLCQWALVMLAVTGTEPGGLPKRPTLSR